MHAFATPQQCDYYQIMNHHVYFVETVENRDQCIPSKPGTTFAYSTMAKAVGDLLTKCSSSTQG